MKTFNASLAVLASLGLSSTALAAHDGFDGKCQNKATRAVRAIDKLNGSPLGRDGYAQLLRQDGNMEVYQAGTDGPVYTVTVKVGPGEKTCTIEELQYNPEN